MSRMSAGSPNEDMEMRTSISTQLGSLLGVLTLILFVGWGFLRIYDYDAFGGVHSTLEVFGDPKMKEGLMMGGAQSGLLTKVFSADNIQKLHWFLFGDNVSSFLAISKIGYIALVNSSTRVGHVLALVTVLNVINIATNLDFIWGGAVRVKAQG